MSHVNKFEEYKLFIEDTARFSERRQKVGSTYVAVNSIILSAIALIVRDSGLTSRWQQLVVIPLLVAGIAICLSWRELVLNYKKLVKLRIDKLRAMEDLPEMAGGSRMYHAEDELYPRDDQGEVEPRQGLNFSDFERWLPWIFLVLYVLFLIGVVVILVLL
jgi:hypothetical protein